jgi:ATP-dependent exoDNAse (exonuclease V) beta subunit
MDGTALGVTFYEGSWAPAAAAGTVPQPPLAVTAERPNPLLVAPLPSATAVREERRRVWQVLPTVEEKDPPGWLIGKLIHEAAEAWRFPEPGFDAWVTARARYYGVSDALRRPLLIARVRLLLLRLRESPLFHLIEGAQRRFHEVPYTLPEEGATGVIDLLLEDVTGRWIIIDFKSEPRTGVRFPRDEHVTQIRRYGAAASRLLGVVPALWLCYLDDDGRVEIRKVDAGKAAVR